MGDYYSNIIDSLIERCENMLFDFKIYQIRRSSINSQSTFYINWYIGLFILSLLTMRAVNFLEKTCLFTKIDSTSSVKLLPNLEKRVRGFLQCRFNDHWGFLYMTILTVCDILVLVAIITQSYPLVYPWLFIMAMTLSAEIIFFANNYHKYGCRPNPLQILYLAHVSYSWYYIYLWNRRTSD